MTKTKERLYSVAPNEIAIDIQDVSKDSNFIALFKVSPATMHMVSNEADREGFALYQTDEGYVVYDWIGFGEDSKILMAIPFSFKDYSQILRQFTYGLNPKTMEPLSYEALKSIFKN